MGHHWACSSSRPLGFVFLQTLVNTQIDSTKHAFSLTPLGFIEDKMKQSSPSKSKTTLKGFCLFQLHQAC